MSKFTMCAAKSKATIHRVEKSMKSNKKILVIGMFVGMALITIPPPSHAQVVTPDEAETIAMDADIYGYPLVTMEMTRRASTNGAKPEGARGAMGHLVRMRE